MKIALEIVQPLETQLVELSATINNQQKDHWSFGTENSDLKDQVVKLASECADLEYSRRDNLIFTDIPASFAEAANGSNPEECH